MDEILYWLIFIELDNVEVWVKFLLCMVVFSVIWL